MPSGFCTGASSHRFTYRTTHGKSVFASTALMTRSLRTLSKNLLDVKVDHPVGSPAAPPADLHRVLRGSPGTVAVRVRMEGRLDPRLQSEGYHRLSDPVGHGRHPQNSGSIKLNVGERVFARMGGEG